MTDVALAAEVGKTKPLVGWRAWKVKWGGGMVKGADGLWRREGDSGPRLISWTSEFQWPPLRALTAAEGAHGPCKGEDLGHPRRGGTCRCGVYAFRRKRKLVFSLDKEMHDDSLIAFGRVSLWGNWVGGPDGWRAEYAYPYALKLVNTDDPGLARVVAEAYAIDVDYGIWNAAAELRDVSHDCGVEGHDFATRTPTMVCVHCGIGREEAARVAVEAAVKETGYAIPDFGSRQEALDWFMATADEMMAAVGSAGVTDQQARQAVIVLRDAMRPILDQTFDPGAIVRPRSVSRLEDLLNFRLPPPSGGL